jgi:hypothetical protein
MAYRNCLKGRILKEVSFAFQAIANFIVTSAGNATLACGYENSALTGKKMTNYELNINH